MKSCVSPTDKIPKPKYIKTIEDTGTNMVWKIFLVCWKIKCWFTIIFESNTEDGNVMAIFNTKINIKSFVNLISLADKLLSNKFEVLKTKIIPITSDRLIKRKRNK